MSFHTFNTVNCNVSLAMDLEINKRSNKINEHNFINILNIILWNGYIILEKTW